ncbi:MAG: AAA family ATPase [Actinomycetota bacterium]|nr:AAA family ATPase [Actinomycetota bacterium]
MSSPIEPAVARFCTEVGDALVSVAGASGTWAERLRDDVTVEAQNLTAAVIDADGRHGDDQLRAYIGAFGHRIDTHLAHASPQHLRDAGLVNGRRSWLQAPSTLFDTLATYDGRHGTGHAQAYYRCAIGLAHEIAAVDRMTSQSELDAIERFRESMISMIRSKRRTTTITTDTAAPAPAPEPGELSDIDAERAELPPPRSLDELFDELDDLIGLDPVKAEVKLVANLIRVQNLRRERDLPVLETSRHLVFTGNPGTGKTTVGRLLAQIYRTLGVVERGHLVETDRSGLVSGFVGQTAAKVVSVFDEADEGVLLIDEAYGLLRGGEKDFGREAIDTIVKLVEDRRDRLVVIMAGYPDEMADLLGSNPGLRSRFPTTIHFPDYTTDELIGIVEMLGDRSQYELDDGARAAVRAHLGAVERGRGFGNGRYSRNLFESAVARHASRVVTIEAPTDHQLITIEAADIPPVPAASDGGGHG